jgi:hypothetical protein
VADTGAHTAEADHGKTGTDHFCGIQVHFT